LWEGLSAMEGRGLLVSHRRDHGDDCYRWRVTRV
jgi:hypothetical protein